MRGGEKLSTMFTCFKLGHSRLVLFVALGSYVGIYYRLVGFDNMFADIATFALFFVPIYLVVATAYGWFDLNRGIYRTEISLGYKNNPEWIAMREDIEELKDNTNELKRLIEEIIADARNVKQEISEFE